MVKLKCIDAKYSSLLVEGGIYTGITEHNKGRDFYKILELCTEDGGNRYMLKKRFVVVEETNPKEEYRLVEVIICGEDNVLIKTDAPKWLLSGLTQEVRNLTTLGNLIVALGYQYSVENGLEEYYTLKS